MEQTVNIPIQMICCVSTQGEFTPIRFRFEDNEHQLVTVTVDSVLAQKNTSFNGIKEIHFTCKAIIAEVERLFVLKFNENSHRWNMFKLLT